MKLLVASAIVLSVTVFVCNGSPTKAPDGPPPQEGPHHGGPTGEGEHAPGNRAALKDPNMTDEPGHFHPGSVTECPKNHTGEKDGVSSQGKGPKRGKRHVPGKEFTEGPGAGHSKGLKDHTEVPRKKEPDHKQSDPNKGSQSHGKGFEDHTEAPHPRKATDLQYDGKKDQKGKERFSGKEFTEGPGAEHSKSLKDHTEVPRQKDPGHKKLDQKEGDPQFEHKNGSPLGKDNFPGKEFTEGPEVEKHRGGNHSEKP